MIESSGWRSPSKSRSLTECWSSPEAELTKIRQFGLDYADSITGFTNLFQVMVLEIVTPVVHSRGDRVVRMIGIATYLKIGFQPGFARRC